MSIQTPKSSLAENMKRALEAKKAASGQGLGLTKGVWMPNRLKNVSSAKRRP